MSGRGQIGASMGGVEMSKSKKRARARRRRAEEAEWAARSGPVVVKRIEPEAETKPESA